MTPVDDGVQRIAATVPVICCIVSGDKPPVEGDVEAGMDTTLGGMTKPDTDAEVDVVG